MVGENHVRRLIAHAAERGIGKFEMRDTLLLPQDGPAPETREQYVRDLADSIRYEYLDDVHLLSRPTDLPDAMAAHREQLMNEYVADVLRARARDKDVGHRWVNTSVERLRKALEEVDTRAEAVMLYELTRLNPSEVKPEERIRWAMLAVRLGKEIDKWLATTEEPLPFVYQCFALASNELGDEAARYLKRQLLSAVARFPNLILLTHVPPLKEACWSEGQISDDEFLPHFTCSAVGDVLIATMRAHPECRLTVLCGHTHGEGEATILPNLLVKTGGADAERGNPHLNKLIIVE